MKKVKNKVIVIIVSLIIILFISQIFIFGKYFSKDTSTYVVLIQGNAEISKEDKNIKLSENKKEKLEVNDIVVTKTPDSLAVIEWGDGSITRMGGNTKIQINTNFVSKNLSKININFSLVNGKTWSNVVSVLGKDSYFEQDVEKAIAAVRGTVFYVDKENDILQVQDHKVDLTDENGKKIEVKSGNAIYISNFRFLNLVELKLKLDQTWLELNAKLDREYLEKLKANILKNINNFSTKKLEKIQKNYKDIEKTKAELMFKYQQLNFIQPGDELYDQKMQYKEALTNVLDNDEKQIFIRNTLYELKDSITQNNTKTIGVITDYLKQNEKYINIDDFSSVFSGFNFEGLNYEIKNTLQKKLEIFKNFNFNDIISTLNKLKNDVSNIDSNDIKQNIQKTGNFFTQILDAITKFFGDLILKMFK